MRYRRNRSLTGSNGDLVAEHGGDFMRVARATDIAQQRDPVDGRSQVSIEAGFLTQPHCEEARTQLRFVRLPERVVLRQGQRGDKLTESQREQK